MIAVGLLLMTWLVRACPWGCSDKVAGASEGPTRQERRPLEGDEFIMSEYRGNFGNHFVWSPSSALDEYGRSHYGLKAHGDRFLVHEDDVALKPNLFVPVENL